MEAVAVERAFPRVAVAAAVKQVDAAMRAVIHFGMLEVQRAFAAGADAFGSALLSAVVIHLSQHLRSTFIWPEAMVYPAG